MRNININYYYYYYYYYYYHMKVMLSSFHINDLRHQDKTHVKKFLSSRHPSPS